jgi:hypothetical protein
LLNHYIELDKGNSLRKTSDVKKLSIDRVAQQEGMHVLYQAQAIFLPIFALFV